MSFGVQSQTTMSLSELSFFAAASQEEGCQEAEAPSHFHEAGKAESSRTSARHYSPLASSKNHLLPTGFKEAHRCGEVFAKLSFPKKPTPLNLASSMASAKTMVKGELKNGAAKAEPPKFSDLPKPQKGLSAEAAYQPSSKTSISQKSQPLPAEKQKLSSEQQPVRQTSKTQDNRSEMRRERGRETSAFVSRQWKREETKEWWEKRYHQKEREQDQRGNRDQQHQQEREKKGLIQKTTGVSRDGYSSSDQPKDRSGSHVKRPRLAPPKLGVFALYFILTKMGILSDGTSNFSYKKEIEVIDLETTETHRKRLAEIREGIKKEQENNRWTIAMKVFSWIASLVGIVAGVALVVTGVGAVAGAMLIAGGAIQLTNQILEVSGGWQKIVALLPGEDSEKKRAVINWIQIGIAVLCLILAGAGAIWGGFSNFGEAMQTAMGVFGGIASMGFGTTTIGEGVTTFFYKDSLAEIQRFDVKLKHLKHLRQDLMDKVEFGIDRLEQLFENLAKALDFEVELFQADQMANRR